MDYTTSDGFITHTPTGQRMHKEQQAVPTAWSEKDANMVVWSLMELVKAGGMAGVQFDPDVPSSYQVLLNSIRNILAASSSDLPGRVSIFMQPTPPTGWLDLDGSLLSRSTFSSLWAHVQTVGAVDEATWAAGRYGWFSSGDGSTTFRVPDFRGLFLRALDGGSGRDPSRVIGAFQAAANLAHTHNLTIASVADHLHGLTINAVSDHDHDTYGGGSGSFQSGGGYGASSSSNGTAAGTTAAAGGHFHTASLTAAGGHTHTGTADSSGGADLRPINLAVPFYIKY